MFSVPAWKGYSRESSSPAPCPSVKGHGRGVLALFLVFPCTQMERQGEHFLSAIRERPLQGVNSTSVIVHEATWKGTGL